jgi:ribulose bisphosphate carboxylase small subunit
MTTKLEIPQAHGEALAERKQILQQMQAQYGIVVAEDRRHTSAVLKSLGHRPEDYAGYEITQEDDRYFLTLRPHEQQHPMPALPENVQSINGSVQPQ